MEFSDIRNIQFEKCFINQLATYTLQCTTYFYFFYHFIAFIKKKCRWIFHIFFSIFLFRVFTIYKRQIYYHPKYATCDHHKWIDKIPHIHRHRLSLRINEFKLHFIAFYYLLISCIMLTVCNGCAWNDKLFSHEFHSHTNRSRKIYEIFKI